VLEKFRRLLSRTKESDLKLLLFMAQKMAGKKIRRRAKAAKSR
jgi:hypothetical protein